MDNKRDVSVIRDEISATELRLRALRQEVHQVAGKSSYDVVLEFTQQIHPKNRTDVFNGVKQVLCDGLGVDPEEVVPSAELRKDLGAESIDYLDIAFRLEKTFGIKLPRNEYLVPEDPSRIYTVQTLVNYISGKFGL